MLDRFGVGPVSVAGVADDDHPTRFRMCIPPRMDLLGVVRHVVEATAARSHIHEDTLADLRLVLTETLANAIEAMARRSDPGDHIELTWQVADGRIDASVTDRGGGIDAEKLAEAQQSQLRAGPLNEGGRGLGLICAFASEANFTAVDRGTEVRFSVVDVAGLA